ncbi:MULTISPECIES: hypothetical protein [unclassified Yoonia]|uniref:hypothetical protein n=1 Tax=unclassified Yoonia TaxID=2629118 RepID=UPI002AFF989F|nr:MULTISPECIES: hypothetical protein [unclassified Yoonia]
MRDRENSIDAEAMDIMKRYPDIFRTVSAPMRDGFLCGPGWYPLLDRLFSDIDTIRRGDALTGIRVSQVKQKLGELRVYVQGGNDLVTDRIRQAEAEAAASCEGCGGPSPGIRSIGGYVTNACDLCLDKRKRDLLAR